MAGSSSDALVAPFPRTGSRPAAVLSGAPAPERFGRYLLLERLGKGGMAEIFRAVVAGPEGFRRQVVLKRILSGYARASTYVDMFVQEARISAMLHHPNIIQVFDFGEVDGTYFLAMELLDGWELRAVMAAIARAGVKMPIEVALHVAHQVLRGLSYAHTLEVNGRRAHVVHRDVSPSNVMCLRAGGVKLLDFGVASASVADKPHARRQFCGKLAYSAPEYVRGEGQDARIDLFAVGVVLWELLTGQRLFRGRSDEETLKALFDRPIVEPSSIRAAVSRETDRIVLKALERDPERRYQAADEMADDLEQVLSERRYKPQSLPRLLNDLFAGQAPLASEPTASEGEVIGEAIRPAVAVVTPGAARAAAVTVVRSILRRAADRRVLALAGSLAMLAPLMMVWTRGPRSAAHAQTQLQTQMQTRAPAPAEARLQPRASSLAQPVREVPGPDRPARPPEAPGPTPPEAPGPTAAEAPASPARARPDADPRRRAPGHPARASHVAAPAGKRKGDRSGVDRVVDPFAEAAARGSLP